MLRRHWVMLSAIVLVAVGSGLWVHAHRSEPAQLIALERATGNRIWQVKLAALDVTGITTRGAGLRVSTIQEQTTCQFVVRDLTVTRSGRVSGPHAVAPETTIGTRAEDADTTYLAVYRPGGRTQDNIELSAADRRTHVVRWRRALTLTDLPDLAAGDGVLTISPRVTAGFSVLDSRTGATLWTSTVRGALPVPGGVDGRVYEVTPATVQARHARTGALVWQRSAGPAPTGFATVVVASDPGQVLIGFGTRLTSRDHDGHLLYRTTLPGGPISRLLLAGPRLYVGVDGKRAGRSCD